jgi:hypothetical protein
LNSNSNAQYRKGQANTRLKHLIPGTSLCEHLALEKVDVVPLAIKHVVDIPVAEHVALVGMVFSEAALVGRKHQLATARFRHRRDNKGDEEGGVGTGEYTYLGTVGEEATPHAVLDLVALLSAVIANLVHLLTVRLDNARAHVIPVSGESMQDLGRKETGVLVC